MVGTVLIFFNGASKWHFSIFDKCQNLKFIIESAANLVRNPITSLTVKKIQFLQTYQINEMSMNCK